MIDTTMIVRNEARPNLTSPAAFNHTFSERLFASQSTTLKPFGHERSFLPKDRALNWLCFGYNWLCIGFELALFFPPYQLPILAYQSIKKALTAFLQMLRLALFSQTNPISSETLNSLSPWAQQQSDWNFFDVEGIAEAVDYEPLVCVIEER